MHRIFLVLSLLTIGLSSLVFSGNANAAWQLRQVKINHVQTGNADYFYMTVAGDVASASGCENMPGGKGWVSFSLNEMDERKRMLMSLALTAYTSGQLVDIGSTTSGCNSKGTAEFQFIRLGDWQQ